MNEIDETLKERGTRYGEFAGHAMVSQDLKAAMRNHANFAYLRDDMKEALEMIQHKIARILNGDPYYVDSWHDIIGYARLVEERLEKEDEAKRLLAAEHKPEESSGAAEGTYYVTAPRNGSTGG